MRVVRAGVVAIVGMLASVRGVARAEPRLEASGFVGVHWFGARTELGNSWAPEQVPGTAPVVGGRVSWLALPALPGGLQLAAEAELALATAFTGANPERGRMAYFAPVFAWRAHAQLRLPPWRSLAPHLVIGAGAATIASGSPFMSRETDPVIYWGGGASVAIAAGWRLRVDLRHGVMPARDGGETSTVELAVGLGVALGGGAAPRPAGAPGATAVADPEGHADRDGDGIPDPLDRCPTAPQTVHDVGDAAGCPAADLDGDGVAGTADRCPDAAEDRDRFEDADGCPDPDNDHDGLPDPRDACPDQPEAGNGFDDADGCPDELPADVRAALATVLRFEPGRARVTAAAGATLASVQAMLERWPRLQLVVVGQPARPGGVQLARRRAEAVKWYLVDRGIPGDRITTRIGPIASGAAIELQLAAAPATP
jgi:hypothetical protein